MSIVSRGVATPADGRPSRDRPTELPLFPRGDDADELDPLDPLELELPPDELDDPDELRGVAVLPLLDPGGAVRCPDEEDS
jgi:hypothetical protein